MRALYALALLLVLGGCATILGIEEATCDPDVDSQCAVGAAGNADAGDDDSCDDDSCDDDSADGGPVVFTSLNALCDEYCSLVGKACTEENGGRQYETDAACTVICRRGMTLGAPGDSSEGNNTAYCRLENARNAGIFGEIDFDCAAAGFGANGTCGPMCEMYCDTLANVCGDEPKVADVEIVHDRDACITECEALPRTPDPFDYEVNSGNSLECRLWHVQAAFGSSSTHCPHAAGAVPCQ